MPICAFELFMKILNIYAVAKPANYFSAAAVKNTFGLLPPNSQTKNALREPPGGVFHF
jgi:hypothetical protein